MRWDCMCNRRDADKTPAVTPAVFSLSSVLLWVGEPEKERMKKKKSYMHKKKKLRAGKTQVIYSILACHRVIVPGLKSLLGIVAGNTLTFKTIVLECYIFSLTQVLQT